MSAAEDDSINDTCAEDGCPKPSEVAGYCRADYLARWRARKKEGEGALTGRGIDAPCRCGCGNTRRLSGKAREAYEQHGTLPYASRECQQRDSQITVPCAREGCTNTKTVYKTYAEKNTTGRFFCSTECRHIVGSRPRTGQQHTCKGCGVAFYRRPGATGVTFHSRACRQEYEQRQRVQHVCPNCGTTFEVIKAWAGRRKYCNKACRDLGFIKNAVPGQWHNGKPKRYEGSGYIQVWEPDHPNTRHGWVFEHRLIMEKALGRHLTRKEEVNHINEIKDDNRLENLEVLDKATHTRVTFTSYRRKAKAERDALEAKLAEYERLYGPLTSSGT